MGEVLTPNLGIPRPGLHWDCGLCKNLSVANFKAEERETLRRVQEGQELMIPTHAKCLEPSQSILHDFPGTSREIVKDFINYNVPAKCKVS